MDGPTGATGTVEHVEQTGTTGVLRASLDPVASNIGPSGLDWTQPPPPPAYLSLFPSAATGPVEPPHITTLEELMSSHAVIVRKEATDKQFLTSLTNPAREQYRPQLFQWAASGFPHGYIIQMLEVTPPAICSDGEFRDAMAYLQFLLAPTTLDAVLETIRELMPGISVTFSFLGNTFRIHVSKG
jgi:hypothetical protein